MKTFWLTIAAALVLAGALQGCTTMPGSYGPSAYTPPPGYILVPAPGNNTGYYGGRYDWDMSGIPSYYRGNPFYLPYYRYGYMPFYHVTPRPHHPCNDCDQHGGAMPPPPAHPPTQGTFAPPRVRPSIIEPRGDRRIPPRMRNSRDYRPHVPEVPAFRRVNPTRAPSASHSAPPPAARPAAVPPPRVHAVPKRRSLPNKPGRPAYRPPQ